MKSTEKSGDGVCSLRELANNNIYAKHRQRQILLSSLYPAVEHAIPLKREPKEGKKLLPAARRQWWKIVMEMPQKAVIAILTTSADWNTVRYAFNFSRHGKTHACVSVQNLNHFSPKHHFRRDTSSRDLTCCCHGPKTCIVLKFNSNTLPPHLS